MRLVQLRISNFRCFDDTTVVFDDYTCFVGPNGAGKSTILAALNVLFRETANAATDTQTLIQEDFHLMNTARPIEIEATFEDLSTEGQEDFKDYYRNGKLIISAVAEWSEATQSAPVKQYGERMGIQAFRVYFDRSKAGAKAGELQEIFDGFRLQYPTLPAARSKQEKEDALHAFAAEHREDCQPIRSEDQFYGVSRGADRLQKYLQWVYIPAVKDASDEQHDSKNTAIGRLLARRVHSQLNLGASIEELKKNAAAQYQELIDGKKDALTRLSEALNKRFHTWAHDGANLVIEWQDTDRNVSISPPSAQVRATEQRFAGSLARFGHGLQRSFIFALLQELADHANTGPKLLLGCEEPELYQHPPQARYLAGVMQQLSSQNAQVTVSTHSPHFVSGRSFEYIRMVRKDGSSGAASVKQATFDDIADTIAGATGAKPAKPGGIKAKIEQEMQGPMNEMFFASVRVLVEGIEDIAYISSYLTLMDRWQEFRSHGCHLVQVQGKHHLVEGIAIAKHFGLPTMVVFDCDGDTPLDDPAKPPTGRRQQHENDNKAVLSLMTAKGVDPFPSATVWLDDVVAWPTKIGDVIEMEIGAEELTKIEAEVRKEHGIDLPKMGKNPLFIGYVMAHAWALGKRSPTLERLCDHILKFCAAHGLADPTPEAESAVPRPLVAEPVQQANA